MTDRYPIEETAGEYFQRTDGPNVIWLRKDPSHVADHDHAHIGLELIHVRAGWSKLWIDGKVYTNRPGRLTVIDATRRHMLFSPKDSVYDRTVIHLLPERLSRHLTQSFMAYLWPWWPWALPGPIWQVDLDSDTEQDVTNLAREARKEFEANLPGAAANSALLIGRLFILLHRLYRATQPDAWRESDPGASVVSRVAAYIREHYADRIGTLRIAADLKVDASNACRAFQRKTGRTISSYLNEYRILTARNLILTTDMSMTDVALEVGYTDPANFSKQFKRWTRLSPTEYRRMYKSFNPE